MSGYRTYALAVAAVSYGLFGLLNGWLTSDQALQVIWAGLAAAGLRAGIASSK